MRHSVVLQINVNECLVAADLAILDASITALGTETGKVSYTPLEGLAVDSVCSVSP